jgi:oxygen-independent coproporphyrinogen-3 oxidase
MGQWLGLGPSAASQFRHRRFRNENSLDCWADGIQKNVPAEEDVVILTDKILLQDKLIFGLRMEDGIRRDLLDAAEVVDFSRCGVLFRRWLRCRFLEIRGENFCPTDRGMLLSDALALEILENAT